MDKHYKHLLIKVRTQNQIMLSLIRNKMKTFVKFELVLLLQNSPEHQMGIHPPLKIVPKKGTFSPTQKWPYSVVLENL